MKNKLITAVLCPTCKGTLMVSNLGQPSKEFMKNLSQMVIHGAVVDHWDNSNLANSRSCKCSFIETLREKMK
jgi:uncharacterized protein YbaR (Trm112 family)